MFLISQYSVQCSSVLAASKFYILVITLFSSLLFYFTLLYYSTLLYSSILLYSILLSGKSSLTAKQYDLKEISVPRQASTANLSTSSHQLECLHFFGPKAMPWTVTNSFKR